MDNSRFIKKSLLCTSILLALGAQSGSVFAAEHGANNSNFSMLDPAGGGVGGTNLVKVTWDGTFNTAVNTAVPNMTISSQVSFFGQLWNAHDVKVFGPGTYVFEACPAPIDLGTKKAADGSLCNGGVSAPLSMTVGPGQVGAHMLFDWNTSKNIDVVNVWDVNAVWAYGPNDATTISMLRTSDSSCIGIGKGADLTTPECVEFFATEWLYTAMDVNGNGVPGSPMVDGPFVGFNANFNIRKQSTYDDALIAVENTSTSTGMVLVNDQLPTTLGAGVFAITAFDATTVQGGSVTDNGDGTLNYLPPLDYTGPDSFTYTVDDGIDHSDVGTLGAAGYYWASATVDIDVIINPEPVVADDSATTENDVPVTTVDVLVNDVFPANGEVFTITAFDAVSVNGGGVVNNGDNTFTFTPSVGYAGADSFTYTVDDGKGHSGTAAVNIEVTDPMPALTDDNASTLINTAVATDDVLVNDVFPANGEIFTITAFDSTSANGGDIVDNGDNTFTFTPASGYVGMDSFTYTVDDGKGHSDTATVNVEVTAQAVPPVAEDKLGSVLLLPLMFLLLPLRLLSRKNKH